MKFVLIFIPVFAFTMFVFRLKDKWYNKQKEEIEQRILVLEKRIEDYRRKIDIDIHYLKENLSESFGDVNYRLLKLEHITRKRGKHEEKNNA